MKVIRKKTDTEKLKLKDWKNAVVEMRELTLQDERDAYRDAKIIFRHRNTEPEETEFQAALIARVGKFWQNEDDYPDEEKRVKLTAQDIIKMPSAFIVACLQGSAEEDEQEEDAEGAQPSENL